MLRTFLLKNRLRREARCTCDRGRSDCLPGHARGKDADEDLVALMALIRPGPLELAPDFIARKHGRQEVEYIHPLVEPILEKLVELGGSRTALPDQEAAYQAHQVLQAEWDARAGQGPIGKTKTK